MTVAVCVGDGVLEVSVGVEIALRVEYIRTFEVRRVVMHCPKRG